MLSRREWTGAASVEIVYIQGDAGTTLEMTRDGDCEAVPTTTTTVETTTTTIETTTTAAAEALEVEPAFTG